MALAERCYQSTVRDSNSMNNAALETKRSTHRTLDTDKAIGADACQMSVSSRAWCTCAAGSGSYAHQHLVEDGMDIVKDNERLGSLPVNCRDFTRAMIPMHS